MCIYHANCADGFGAAWAVWKRYGYDVEYVAAGYGSEPPDIAGKNVLIVDFSYKYDVLAAMSWKARRIVILDHHKTAQEDLQRLPWFDGTEAGVEVAVREQCWTQNMPEIVACFDMNRSGARMAWDYCHPSAPPFGIRFIEDRDLWRFTMDKTRDVHAALLSYEMSFSIWDALFGQAERDAGADLARQGEAIERRQRKDIAALLGASKRTMVIGGHEVPVANVPFHLSSDAGHVLNEGVLFAATYLDTADGRAFSLRSRGDFDVSAIAKSYGGGGHKNAAGFKMPRGWEGESP